MPIMEYVQSLWSPFTPSSLSVRGAAHAEASPSPSHAATARNASSSGASAQQIGSGVWPLSPQMREEMKKGTRYNMKVILRGTKATGKSTLLARLTGHPLPPFYTPSTEIVASTMRLQGENCAANEGTKVDIWEVAEEGRQRPASLSASNTTENAARHVPSAQLQEALRIAADARLLNIYTGAHLTIFLIDPRQRASWDYAKQESLHVPPTCCILYALNFSDAVAIPSASSSPSTASLPLANVSLEEVQIWCARMRRATTGVVHHLLEGRQAPEEFSVRPMTAVLSTLSGAGIMSVVRAIHVASTLLRIATEEVRVTRLFELLARQQAVKLSDDVVLSEPPTNTTPESPASGKATGSAPGKDASGKTSLLSVQTSPSCSRGQTSPAAEELHTQTVNNLARPGAATAANKTTALRMEHRPMTSLSTSGGAAAGLRKSLLFSNASATGTIPTRALSDAEAMKLFLGSDVSSSGKSNSSSRSSSASTPSSSKIARMNGVTYSNDNNRVRAMLNARQTLPSKLTGEPRVSEKPSLQKEIGREQAEKRAGIAAVAAIGASAPSGLSEATRTLTDVARKTQVDPGTTENRNTTAGAARLPDEEVMRTLATTMVHDADAPADDFFQESSPTPRDGAQKGQLNQTVVDQIAGVEERSPFLPADEEEALPTDFPGAAVQKKEGLRARPLCTQRMVRRTAVAQPATTSTETTPALQAEVSSILAAMTAVLSSAVPTAQSDVKRDHSYQGLLGAAASVGCDLERDPSETAGEKLKRKKTSKHHRTSKDSAFGGCEHEWHKKHCVHRSTEDEHPASRAGSVGDDGSFELLLT